MFRIWCIENQSVQRSDIGAEHRRGIGVTSECHRRSGIGVEHRSDIRATFGVAVLCCIGVVEGEAQDGQEGPVLCQFRSDIGAEHRRGIGVTPE